jgi:hypothetical protein
VYEVSEVLLTMSDEVGQVVEVAQTAAGNCSKHPGQSTPPPRLDWPTSPAHPIILTPCSGPRTSSSGPRYSPSSTRNSVLSHLIQPAQKPAPARRYPRHQLPATSRRKPPNRSPRGPPSRRPRPEDTSTAASPPGCPSTTTTHELPPFYAQTTFTMKSIRSTQIARLDGTHTTQPPRDTSH